MGSTTRGAGGVGSENKENKTLKTKPRFIRALSAPSDVRTSSSADDLNNLNNSNISEESRLKTIEDNDVEVGEGTISPVSPLTLSQPPPLPQPQSQNNTGTVSKINENEEFKLSTPANLDMEGSLKSAMLKSQSEVEQRVLQQLKSHADINGSAGQPTVLHDPSEYPCNRPGCVYCLVRKTHSKGMETMLEQLQKALNPAQVQSAQTVTQPPMAEAQGRERDHSNNSIINNINKQSD